MTIEPLRAPPAPHALAAAAAAAAADPLRPLSPVLALVPVTLSSDVPCSEGGLASLGCGLRPCMDGPLSPEDSLQRVSDSGTGNMCCFRMPQGPSDAWLSLEHDAEVCFVLLVFLAPSPSLFRSLSAQKLSYIFCWFYTQSTRLRK